MKPYPFSAIVGHDQMRLALLLCAVRPEIGGALIRGEKGTAKSTAVRGLAALLAAATGSDPDIGAGLVEMPLGATEDRVIGSLERRDPSIVGGAHSVLRGRHLAEHVLHRIGGLLGHGSPSVVVGAPYMVTVFMDILMRLRPRAQRIALFAKTREESHKKILERYATLNVAGEKS